jgi:hypothetical protein
MKWLSRYVVGVALLIAAFRGPAYQIPTSKPEKTSKELLTLSSEEEKESYDIYSTVLQIKEPNVTGWTIIQETRGFELCSKPTRDQDVIYRPMIDDYVLKNRKTLVLERQFKLPQYTLAAPEEWTRSTNGRIFAVLSAVGFNQDRTRATVCFWAHSSGTCSILIKNKGTWQIDPDWRGDGCGWAASGSTPILQERHEGYGRFSQNGTSSKEIAYRRSALSAWETQRLLSNSALGGLRKELAAEGIGECWRQSKLAVREPSKY